MDWGGAESCAHMLEGDVLYFGEFVCVLFLTIPPDWAGICHDTSDTCSINCAEETLVQSPYRVTEHRESFCDVFCFVGGRFDMVVEE